jgi:16S rRNA (cytidine1402-2'-O)-methyltransferase
MPAGHGSGVRWRAPGVAGAGITKTFETLKGLPLAELRAFVEATAISSAANAWCWWRAGRARGEDAVSSEAMRVLDLLLEEMPLKRAAALAAEITGERKNVVSSCAG